MGHIGFTSIFKKFKVQGKLKSEASKMIREAMFIQKAGAFAVVLECVFPKIR